MTSGLVGLPPAYFEIFFLVLMRVSAVIMTLPILSSRNIPAAAKIGAAALLAFVLTPTLPAGLPAPPTQALPFLLVVAQELLIGVTFGFTVQIVFSGLQMAGQFLGLQMGLSIANTLDPVTQSHQISYIDQIYALLVGMVFLTINGHHLVLQALQTSFQIVPLGQFVLGEAVADDLVGLITRAFIMALRIGLPVGAALFLTDIAFLIIGRTAPQMNVFFVGQPVKIGVGLIAFFLALPVMVAMMGDVLRGLGGDLGRFLAAAAG